MGTNLTTMYLLNTLCPKPSARCIHITCLIQLRQQFCERSTKEIVAQSEEVTYQKPLLANRRALFEPNPLNTTATKLLSVPLLLRETHSAAQDIWSNTVTNVTFLTAGSTDKKPTGLLTGNWDFSPKTALICVI